MSLNNMKTRLNYMGGINQQDRMNEDKLKSLKKALLYSYQAATAKLSDGREFRCLINPNKLSLDLDNKILSIPFEDKSINQPENGVEVIGIKEGDVIEWKENGSHWLVYLRRLEETAYFRADIRRCRYEIALDNGSKYWIYIRGPVEQSLVWNSASNNYFNKLNNTLIMYISQNEETLKYFNRFRKIIINNQPWEVQVVDSISTPGVLEVSLKETYINPIETNLQDVVQESQEPSIVQDVNTKLPYIFGLNEVYPYDIIQYELKNYNGGGSWLVTNESRKNMIKFITEDPQVVKLQILTGKSGTFTLAYKEKDKIITELNIIINSL